MAIDAAGAPLADPSGSFANLGKLAEAVKRIVSGIDGEAPPIDSGNPPPGPKEPPPPDTPAPAEAPAPAKEPATAKEPAPAKPAETPKSTPAVGDPGTTSSELFSDKVPNGPLSKEASDKLAETTVQALMKDLGITREQAAGIVGNLYHESAGMNPHVNEFGQPGATGPDDPGSFGKPLDSAFGYGWAQWSGSRKEDFKAFAAQQGLDPGSPRANYEFLLHELRTSESKTVNEIKTATTPEEAAVIFRSVFERAAMPNDPGRTGAARTIFGANA